MEGDDGLVADAAARCNGRAERRKEDSIPQHAELVPTAKAKAHTRRVRCFKEENSFDGSEWKHRRCPSSYQSHRAQDASR